METLLSLAGIVGALCCVAMYAAVSLGRIEADRPSFFLVNGLGALLVLVGASHQFDMGDIGTIGQELIWSVLSLVGAGRAWLKAGGAKHIKRARRTARLMWRRVIQSIAIPIGAPAL